jgi:signal transduction histidine kinase
MNNFQALALLACGIHLALALTVWSMLHRRWRRLPLGLWVAGSLAMGVGGSLFVLPGAVPTWAGNSLANALLLIAPVLRIAALRLDLSWRVHGRMLALLCTVAFGAWLLAKYTLPERVPLLLGFATNSAWTLAFAWHAAAAGRQLQSRSALVLAGVEAFFGVTMLVRLLAMGLDWTPAHRLTDTWDFGLLVCGGLAAALYGNLGYLGLVLDRTSARARQARDAQLAETLRREAAESASAELRGLLQQREDMLQLLAHEIRQPLHNASGALQAAMLSLEQMPATAADVLVHKERTAERLLRSQAVLGRVQTVLDNTLAASTLFSRDAPVTKVDTDLEFLIQLSLGDLPAAQRLRVLVHQRSPRRSAELEPGLVRLALRNLLLNAFVHGGAQVQVALEVAEQAEPAALLLRVMNDGPPLAPALLQQLRGVAVPATAGTAPNRRLGLLIVRKLMALHGGSLQIDGGTRGGLVATLVFPIPASPGALPA